jgi:hypothetical protein
MSGEESEIRVEEAEQGTSEKIKSKRTHPVWEYFNIMAETKQWSCKLCKCPKVSTYKRNVQAVQKQKNIFKACIKQNMKLFP